jgi:hypothetical protein
MELFPPLHPGWLNGWIFLPFVYLMTEGLVKVLPKDIAAKLTDYSGWSRADRALARLGGIPMLAFFVILVLQPLPGEDQTLPEQSDTSADLKVR